MQGITSKLCFIDVETSGLTPGVNSILQLAGCIDINREVKESFNWKCAPFEGARVDPGALVANNTTYADFEGRISADTCIREFREICGQYVSRFDKRDKMFFVAYNSRFDEDFVRAHFLHIHDKFYGSYFWAPSLCVMQMALQQCINIRQTLPDFKLGTVASHFLKRDVTQDGLHDASTDITITRELFYTLYRNRQSGGEEWII